MGSSLWPRHPRSWIAAGLVLCLVAVGGWACLAPGPATVSGDDGLGTCRAIPDGPRRLACYDAIAPDPAMRQGGDSVTRFDPKQP
jgi:hypothetical protein